MHVRFSTALGLPVCEEGSHLPLGHIAHIVIHPDTGRIEGFFVGRGGFFGGSMLFLPTMDILRWSLRVVVSSADVLCDPADVVRLEPLFAAPRPILGQRIVTVGGKPMGKCRDVQFDTTHFLLEWLFPKSLWTWGVPVPASHIAEVREDAIVIRDTKADVKEKAGALPTPATMLPPVTEPEAA